MAEHTSIEAAYMRWRNLGLREKSLLSHLLVAAASTIVLILSVLLLAPWVFAPSPPGSSRLLATFAIIAIVLLVGAFIAIAASRWLYEQTVAPLKHAESLARRLAAGQYGDGLPTDGAKESLPSPSIPHDDLSSLTSALDELAASLEAAERRRMDSYSEITHELRTPIAILEGYLEGLLDGHVKPSDETWAMLYDVASRAHRLVDELQALSRAETKQEPPDLQAVDPRTIARSVLDRLSLHFQEKGLEVAADIPDDLPTVLADPDHAVQILINLLTNALRYTPVPGTVTLSVSRFSGEARAEGIMGRDTTTSAAAGPGEVVFRVSDTGVGIAPEHIPHLFERFFRVDRSGGSGIGLPLAKALVEAMGGRIWAESPGLGAGSSFCFTLLISTGPAPTPR